MKFIKRLIFVLILLLIAFFIYRLISPTAAKQLIYDLKSFSNTTIHTHFSLSGETMIDTGMVVDLTGMVIEDAGGLQEITGDEELLFTDIELSQDLTTTGFTNTGTIITGELTTGTTVTTSSNIVSTPLPSPLPPVKKSSGSKGLSAQDKRDTNMLLQNFGH